MTAFTIYELAILERQVKERAQGMIEFHQQDLKLTHEDFLELFAYPEDREILRQAAIIGRMNYSRPPLVVRFPGIRGNDFSGLRIGLLVHDMPGKLAPLIPVNVMDPFTISPAQEYSLELVQHVTSWVRQRYEIGVDFGVVNYLLGTLNEQASLAQVRTLWPSVQLLCKPFTTGPAINVDDSTALALCADKLAAAKPPKTLPPVPPWMRAACRRASMTLTASELVLGSSLETPPPREVDIYLDGSPRTALVGWPDTIQLM